ncbi:cobyric acid synthase [Thermanaeromonas sp. C210]|uniref:cobyric acid synthase n=1 Tax=Thermanaeromonas sp. C210 TaxID=2731925 RepID=UPI00155BDBB3|nr:cobyric acid synthase [Thermanaeromonas sp. C210]GFN23772.1 cobyric acid synthase [Thermanaeromonas sp. C210]
MARAVMLQGTSSNVGKSVLAAALCRIFYRAGYRVAPFKSQNMALNSGATADGGEMGRAQLVQAYAAGVQPRVEMNPILLKPTAHARSQVILLGRPVGNVGARDYHGSFNQELWRYVEAAYAALDKEFEVIVIEGAGSPAEVNLKDREIANMRVAKMAGAPVLLVADIDRGGALAAIVGTLELLEEDERELVAGLIINKFRGDMALLQPALDFLEKKTGKPVLGVIPFLAHGLPEEDSVVLEKAAARPTAPGEVEIVVIKLPCIANFTDFDALAREEGVNLRYVEDKNALGNPDLIILPGSKNTIGDLLWLRQRGLEDAIKELAARGTPVVGICGGYQMLGREIADPGHVETDYDGIDGMGLLPVRTVFQPTKATNLVEGRVTGTGPFLGPLQGLEVKGYEIHMGASSLVAGQPAFKITRRGSVLVDIDDGAQSDDGLVWGTYIHGIWDNDAFRHRILDVLRARRGLPARESGLEFDADQERRFDALAAVVARHLDLKRLAAIMGLDRPLAGDGFGA